MNIETQLKSALVAASSLEKAGVRVIEVIHREGGVPFILVDGQDAEDIILTDKMKLKPCTYDRCVTQHGFISEVYKCEYMGCVVWFTILSNPKDMKLKGNEQPRLN